MWYRPTMIQPFPTSFIHTNAHTSTPTHTNGLENKCSQTYTHVPTPTRTYDIACQARLALFRTYLYKYTVTYIQIVKFTVTVTNAYTELTKLVYNTCLATATKITRYTLLQSVSRDGWCSSSSVLWGVFSCAFTVNTADYTHWGR